MECGSQESVPCTMIDFYLSCPPMRLFGRATRRERRALPPSVAPGFRTVELLFLESVSLAETNVTLKRCLEMLQRRQHSRRNRTGPPSSLCKTSIATSIAHHLDTL